MRRIAILGCENSHADQFLNFIKNYSDFLDIEVVGIYSDEKEPAERLSKLFGINVLENYDSAVGMVDGIVITARHGDNHIKYALPYINDGIPMFIDKPFTVNETDAVKFGKLLKEKNVPITGGSSLAKEEFVCQLSEEAKAEADGKTIGGFVRAPLDANSQYGGFFFYAQHLTEMVMKIFGNDPISVRSAVCDNKRTVLFRYSDFDVTGLFVENNYVYYAARFAEQSCNSKQLNLRDSKCFFNEFMEFYKLLCGEEQKKSYEDFVKPVFIMNAIYRSFESGKEEKVGSFEL